ncbi:hypothetical protein PCANC_25724 [Puccinia coronata f. sp. avenae]|uniref:Uncharacterized protein n=1 Tax=Puccinia coronata f. sp. avenae TaxID=200324 RepID=A0A2N5U7J9_9BASI|nr:hypothetical protein PCANC_25724 [Puccinia coronata f. sp. avenae]
MESGLPLFNSGVPLDMEGGFSALKNPSRHGPTATGSTFNTNRGTTTPLAPPPKVDKGMLKEQYCTRIEDLPEDKEEEHPQQHQNQYQHLNPFHQEPIQYQRWAATLNYATQPLGVSVAAPEFGIFCVALARS